MKRIILVAFIACLAISEFSCSKDEDGANEAKDNNSASYYVKYEASNSLYYLQSVTVATDSGTKTFMVKSRSWSQTFGPVSKGFHARISVGVNGGNTTKGIYISKDGGPFALKGTSSYTIDF